MSSEPRYVLLRGTVASVRFVVGLPHGRGTRDVEVDVPPDLILKIADALRGSGPQCCGKHWRISDQSYVPHAIWHVQHPEEPMPCIDGGTVIDVPDESRMIGADAALASKERT